MHFSFMREGCRLFTGTLNIHKLNYQHLVFQTLGSVASTPFVIHNIRTNCKEHNDYSQYPLIQSIPKRIVRHFKLNES